MNLTGKLRPFLTLSACCIALLSSVQPATSQQQPQIGDETVPEFEAALQALGALENLSAPISVEDIEAGGEDPNTELINGLVVDGTFFPAVLRASNSLSCTSALIGPSTVILAAHCFASDYAVFDFKVAGRTVRGVCESAPGFEDRRSEDWALCVLERRISGITFETVDLETRPAVGSKLVLVGYGCTFEGEEPAIRPLRTGITRIAAHPSGSTERSYIETRSDPDAGEAILCKGDSGGPAFVVFGNTRSSSRVIVGINSRTHIATGKGLISATASPAGSKFIKDWVARYDQAICGYNATTNMNCMWSE